MFVYSLLRSVEAKRLSLVYNSNNRDLSEAEDQQLKFLQKRGSHFLLTSAIAKCLETFLNKSVPSTFRVSFGTTISPPIGEKYWEPIVEITITFCKHLLPAVRISLNSNDEAAQAISNFKDVVESIKGYHVPRFQLFSSQVHIRS